MELYATQIPGNSDLIGLCAGRRRPEPDLRNALASILRTLTDTAPDSDQQPVRLLGDGRLGMAQGSVLRYDGVDLERRSAVGMLPDGSAENLAKWLQQQPTVVYQGSQTNRV